MHRQNHGLHGLHGPKVSMQVFPPLYALQRLASGQLLVRAPVDDPLLPEFSIVDLNEESEIYFDANCGRNIRPNRIKQR